MSVPFAGRGLIALLLFGFSWLAAALHAGDKLTLHLVYTSDTIGYVDPCG